MGQERIKDKDRLAIIAEYIKTGVAKDGFSVTEAKDGKYRVRRIKSDVDKLNTKRDRLKKRLEEVEALIAKGLPVEEVPQSTPTAQTPEAGE